MDWRMRATCRNKDPEMFFPIGENWKGQATRLAQAKSVCRACPVATECLQFALDNGLDHGVFGGMTADERRALRGERVA